MSLLSGGIPFHAPGASVYSNTGIAPGILVVITAATNTNGIIVRSLVCTATVAGVMLVGLSGTSRYYRAPNPPASAYDEMRQAPIIIPPGVNLELNISGSGTANVYITYDLR